MPDETGLAGRIDREKSNPLPWKTVAKRAATVLVAGIAIYLVFPAITEVFASWPKLSTLDPWWLIAAFAAEAAHFVCTFALQRLALLEEHRAAVRAELEQVQTHLAFVERKISIYKERIDE